MNRTKTHTITIDEIDGHEVNAVIASSKGKRLSYVFKVGQAFGMYVVTVDGNVIYCKYAGDGIHDAIEAYNNAEVAP